MFAGPLLDLEFQSSAVASESSGTGGIIVVANSVPSGGIASDIVIPLTYTNITAGGNA